MHPRNLKREVRFSRLEESRSEPVWLRLSSLGTSHGFPFLAATDRQRLARLSRSIPNHGRIYTINPRAYPGGLQKYTHATPKPPDEAPRRQNSLPAKATTFVATEIDTSSVFNYLINRVVVLEQVASALLRVGGFQSSLIQQ